MAHFACVSTPIPEILGSPLTLVNYNSVLCTIGDQTCSLQYVLCPDSEFWEPSDLAVTWSKKKELIQAYLLLKRSKEELALFEKEGLNTVHYWFKLKSAINKHLLSLKPCDKYSVGVIALLKTRLSIAEHHHSACKAVFASIDRDDDDSNNEESSSEDEESDFE